MHNQNRWAKFSRGILQSFLICFLRRKKCQILQLPQHKMVHASRKNAKSREKCNISCICRTHLSSKIRHLNLQNRDYTCVVSFFFYLSTIVAQLLFDLIKHAVAHFASFLSPFCWCYPFCVFKTLHLLIFSIQEKHICMEKYGKET